MVLGVVVSVMVALWGVAVINGDVGDSECHDDMRLVAVVTCLVVMVAVILNG